MPYTFCSCWRGALAAASGLPGLNKDSAMSNEFMSVVPEVPQERAGTASEYHEQIFPINEWFLK